MPKKIEKNHEKIEQLELDLEEPPSEILAVTIQPSLREVFEKRCETLKPRPVRMKDMIRNLIIEWIKETKEGSIYFD